MNGAECLLRTLASNGIRVCFMNPGTSEMQFVAALDRVPEIRPVLGLFEGVCSGAADGYARMSRIPAATLLHLGPGLGNALSNFHNARKANSPVVSIVGEHTTAHLQHNAPLTADIAAFARTVSEHVLTLRSAGETGAAAAEAIRLARMPPGGVSTLIIPADFSWSPAGDPGPVFPADQPGMPDRKRLDAAEALVRTEGSHVGFFLGGSALFGAGLESAGRIAAGSTARMFANRYSGRMESGAGSFQPVRLPYFPEAAEAALAGMKHLILVESGPPVSFFGYPGRRSVVAPEDCQFHVLAEANENGSAALAEIAGRIGAPPKTYYATGGDNAEFPRGQVLTLPAVGQTLRCLLPAGAILSDEMVSSSGVISPYLLKAARHDHLPVTGGSIGQGLPVALGAAIACPNRKVIALEADGSALYSMQALWTMAREQLDVLTIILANRRYRILEIEMRRTGAGAITPEADRMIDLRRPDLDFVALATGLGVPASRATSADDFAEQVAFGLRERGPRLIEAVLANE